jgi:glycosyltransferase involved in cell wall biosynthesis
MRVLFVAPYVPSPARLRSFRIVRALARLGHDISVVALGSGDSARDAREESILAKYCGDVSVVPHSKSTSLLQCTLHVATSVPVWAAACFSPRLEAVLADVMRRGDFDVAHVEHLRAARYARVLRDRLPVVYDAVDCISDIEESRQDPDSRGMAEMGVAWQEHAKLVRYEPRCASEFDRVVVSSEYSAGKLTELATEQGLSFPIEVIPNGVDLEYFSSTGLPDPAFGAIAIVGDTAHREIRDAVSYFCSEIFPAVRQAYPSAAFTLIGEDQSGDLASLAADPEQRVTVTGRVDDVRPYLARASVIVWPIRVGNRPPDAILQTLSMGRAVVATPEACRRLSATAPRDALCLADTPLSFVTQILHLMNHPEEVARLGGKARAFVEENHDWNRTAERLATLYAELSEARSDSALPVETLEHTAAV